MRNKNSLDVIFKSMMDDLDYSKLATCFLKRKQ